jgi:mannose-1-phosphate guanylyltransferase
MLERSEDMREHFYALIMAGGGGTRLWPLSRKNRPKQSLPLVSDQTLFHLSVERLLPLFSPDRIFVVTGANYVDGLHQDMPELSATHFIAEPFGQDSGPAAGLGIVHIAAQDPEATIAVLTADHHIADREGFLNALTAAYQVAQKGHIVTLGITPSFPSTGFGYIQRGAYRETVSGLRVYDSNGFREKPDLKTALEFVTSGEFSWNSGMFIWTATQALAEFARQQPTITQQLETIRRAMNTPNYEAILRQVWPKMDKLSVDYAIMEHAERVAVIPVEIGWVDIGSWAALYNVLNPERADEHHNVLHRAENEALLLDTSGTLVSSERLVVTIGVQDLVIVDTEDALLVCHRERSQDIRAVVDRLRASGKEALL